MEFLSTALRLYDMEAFKKPGKYCWKHLQVIWLFLQREDYSHGGSFYSSAVIRRGGFQVLNKNNEVLSENI